MSNLKIAVIIASTRPGRVGDQVGKWVFENASHDAAEFELVDLADYNLPNLGQPTEDVARWSATIASFDGFIFVTPEYNHSIPGGLKNAIDYLRDEWWNKAAGIASYGSIGGARATEHLRGILGELKVADVRQHLMFSLFTDFEGGSKFTPAVAQKLPELQELVNQVVSWAGALKTIRSEQELVSA
jgi:NAD(P)H-dependent FMN reductase